MVVTLFFFKRDLNIPLFTFTSHLHLFPYLAPGEERHRGEHVRSVGEREVVREVDALPVGVGAPLVPSGERGEG